MVLYDFDNNVILAEAIKSRKKMDLVQGYNALYEMLQKAGIIPVLHKLDNEAPEELIKAITEKGIQYQLAPPGDHQINPVECAVQTFKNHFNKTNGID